MNFRAVLSLSALLVLAGVASFVTKRFLPSLSPAKSGSAESPVRAPVDPTAWLGELDHLSPEPSSASPIKAAVQAVRATPASAESWVRLGDALTARSQDRFDFSLYQPIDRIYRQALQLDSSNVQALVGLAWATGASHHFDESIVWARLAIKADPENPTAYAILGDAAVELGQFEEASQQYQKMLDLRPDTGAYRRAARLLYLQGNVPRAMHLIRKAIDAGAGDTEPTAAAVAELAMMQCREGASPAAVRLIDPWLAKMPENPALLAASGQAHMAANEDAAAIAALERAVAIVPQHTTLAALHDLYLAAGRTEEADRMADQIERLHLQFQKEHIYGSGGQLARFYADRGVKLNEAVRLAEQEYSDRRGSQAADTLAWAYFRAGRVADAQKLRPEILRRRVSDPAMLYHVALVEEAAGNGMEARRHLYAALSRDPRFNPVHAPIAQETLRRLSSVPAVTLLAQKP
jgi:tetratricopeptide (TPR) repeat protein